MPSPRIPATEPASLQGALDDNGETPVEDGTAGEADRREALHVLRHSAELSRSSLRNKSRVTAADATPQAIVEPGVYVLQAGSFSTHNDADRRRAELALHGIESHIQRVKVNDRNYHRVYIGPTDDLDELNILRSRLRAAKIDVFRIRLSDELTRRNYSAFLRCHCSRHVANPAGAATGAAARTSRR